MCKAFLSSSAYTLKLKFSEHHKILKCSSLKNHTPMLFKNVCAEVLDFKMSDN